MKKASPLFLAVLFAAPLLHGADWEAEARRLRPADHAVSDDAVVRNLSVRMKSQLDSLQRSTTQAQADQARPALQEALRNSLGYKRLPWPPDLQARTVSTVKRKGYRIEKVVFQGLPGEWIPAHLYVPDGLTSKAPGILFYNGHWFPDSKSRPDFQAFCINMARMGFIVLNFDTYGQGERGLSWRDHRRTEGLLVGVAQQGFATYDSQVALEYLLTRKEVDSERIGMTGASGGGFDTWMNAALDDRIKVAVPVVGTCNFYEQAMIRIERDWDPFDQCHYVPKLFQYANNHELVAMAAPKPILVVSATADRSFPIAGVHEIVNYARTLYGSYGKPEHFGFAEDGVDAHGYQVRKREAAYGWFLRFLMNKGDGSPVQEPPTETMPFDSLELRCFPPGENQGSGRAMISAVRKLADRSRPSNALDLTNVLGPLPAPVDWKPEISDTSVQRLVMPIEPELNIPMVLVRPTAHAKGLLVVADDRGKESALADTAVQALASAGWAVLGVDPRGIGELATARKTWVFAISLMMGENFVMRQSWDLLRAATLVNQSPMVQAPQVAIYTRGNDTSLAATYLLGQTAKDPTMNVRWFVLRDGFVTWHDFIDRPKSMPASFRLLPLGGNPSEVLDREIPHDFMPFQIAGHFDLPRLLAASGVPGLIVNPINGDWEPKDAASSQKLVPSNLKVVNQDKPDAAILEFARQR